MVLLVALAFWMPGTVLGLALGLRSWTLGAAAPALTFGAVALGVPVLGDLGIRWGVWSVAVWVLLLSAAAFGGTRMLARPATARDHADELGVPAWRSSLVVALGVAGGGWPSARRRSWVVWAGSTRSSRTGTRPTTAT